MPPIYMDRFDLPGVSAEDVAKAHQEYLKAQEKFGCRFLTYWFNEEREKAFCLIEAPNKNSVIEMHAQAHGLRPHLIIEVDSNVVKTFLGRIEPPVTSDNPSNSDLFVLKDPAFRAILATDLKDAALMYSKLREKEALQVLGNHNEIIRKLQKLYDGREVQHSENGFLASFASVSQAVTCAIEIQKNFKKSYRKIPVYKVQVRIGVSAGIPVTENNSLFGQWIQLAKQLCYVAGSGQIAVSSVVKDICKKEGLNVFSKGNLIKIFNPSEEEFLHRLMEITETNWNDSEFNIYSLAKQIGVSKSQLYRKIISMTGYSPNDFIKEFRLQKAIKSLGKQQGNISEIAYQSGFASPCYFSKCFKKRFDVLPSKMSPQ